MTEQMYDTTNLIFMAIDVAKHKHDVLICFPAGKQVKLKIPNTLAGFSLLLDCVNLQTHTVIADVEPTADYHRAFAYWLNQQRVIVHLVLSLAAARAREMLFKTWDKHDRKDTQVILYLLNNGLTQLFHDPLINQYMDIQELSNTYHQIVLVRSRCLHSLLNHYLTLYFPEMERYFHSSRANRLCQFC